MSGEELVAWRKAAGLTQAELAEEMGVTRGMVSHWENRSPITKRTARQLQQLAERRNLPTPGEPRKS